MRVWIVSCIWYMTVYGCDSTATLNVVFVVAVTAFEVHSKVYCLPLYGFINFSSVWFGHFAPLISQVNAPKVSLSLSLGKKWH